MNKNHRCQLQFGSAASLTISLKIKKLDVDDKTNIEDISRLNQRVTIETFSKIYITEICGTESITYNCLAP